MSRVDEFFKRRPAFSGSFPSVSDMPRARVPEIAFIGRSNVGKSSLINAIFRAPGLAKTSSTPGRTQTLNLFSTGGLSIVDLPGYGYAKAPPEEARKWALRVREYLFERRQLRRVFLLIDARVGAKKSDEDMTALLDEAGIDWLAVLTKTDKAKGAKAYEGRLATSSESGEGLEELRREIFRSCIMAPRDL